MKRLFIITLTSIILPCSVFAQDKRPDEFPTVSYNNLAVEDFNLKISSAVRNGENWIFHPLSVIWKLQKINDTRFVSILMKNDKGEDAVNSVVTIVEEGYHDDSVRGQRVQFHLNRPDGKSAWKIKEIRQAYLCGRMNSPEEFSKEPCP